jgi:hypothetical protein
MLEVSDVMLNQPQFATSASCGIGCGNEFVCRSFEKNIDFHRNRPMGNVVMIIK